MYERGELPEDVNWHELGIDPQVLLEYIDSKEKEELAFI